MLVVAAPDKYRGTASATEAAAAMAAGAAAAGWKCAELPLADGGEGTLEALGGPTRASIVTVPLGSPVEAAWRLSSNTAVIELARASGLLLAGGREQNNPMTATNRGTGELIADAIKAGARRILVGAGGSATTDGGLGTVEVLERYRPLDDTHGPMVLVACDVRTTFVEAAAGFGPQKGASSGQVASLARRLRDMVRQYQNRYCVDIADLPGAGAAGGLGGGLAALGALLVSGFDLIAEEVGLPGALGRADLVLTEERRLDAHSFSGKVVGGTADLADRCKVASYGIVGNADPRVNTHLPIISPVDTYGLQRVWSDTLGSIADCVEALLTTWDGASCRKALS